jgi:hypothetical protein
MKLQKNEMMRKLLPSLTLLEKVFPRQNMGIIENAIKGMLMAS